MADCSRKSENMDKTIVITGMGAVTPIGTGVETYWNNLIAGHCGIAPIRQCDTTALPVKVAAEIKDFDPAALLPKPLLRETVPFMQYGYAAAQEALILPWSPGGWALCWVPRWPA